MVKVAGVIKESIVDGPGMRYVVFTQGCPHQCKGCQNPQTHTFEGGKYLSCEEILKDIDKNPLISGVTFSGGEPFCQPKELYSLAKKIKERRKNIMIYSGYTFEQLMKMGNDIKNLLQTADILVDGKFDIAKKDLLLKFRGSSNQRIIDIKRSLELGAATLKQI